VLLFGNGQYRHESIYLSLIPASQFWSGENGEGIPSTQYFAGLDANGHPTWTTTELCAVPVVYDNPTNLQTNPSCTAPVDPGRAGNVSVTYNKTLSLWLMTWDGGEQPGAVGGIFFSYASAPWGPWSHPQNIYNACEAHNYGEGYGDFIRFTGDAAKMGPIHNLGHLTAIGPSDSSFPARKAGVQPTEDQAQLAVLPLSEQLEQLQKTDAVRLAGQYSGEETRFKSVATMSTRRTMTRLRTGR